MKHLELGGEISSRFFELGLVVHIKEAKRHSGIQRKKPYFIFPLHVWEPPRWTKKRGKLRKL